MKPPLIAIEIFLGFGVPIAWGVWELISLKREREKDKLKSAAASETAAASEPKAH